VHRARLAPARPGGMARRPRSGTGAK
jgi:hypothetical protein